MISLLGVRYEIHQKISNDAKSKKGIDNKKGPRPESYIK